MKELYSDLFPKQKLEKQKFQSNDGIKTVPGQVWYHVDRDQYYIVCSSRSSEGTALIVLYSLDDGIAWCYDSTFGTHKSEFALISTPLAKEGYASYAVKRTRKRIIK